MKKLTWILIIIGCIRCTPPTVNEADNNQSAAEQLARLVARGDSLELNTPYTPPPGDPLSHHTAGFAKIMCSAVFITGLDPEFAAVNVGGFAAPFDQRTMVGKPVIDYEKKAVSITLPSGVTRTAVYTGDQSQGCVCLAEGEQQLHFQPRKVERKLADAASQDWPMGDRLATQPASGQIDLTKIKAAVDTAFAGNGMTAAVVVTHKGQIVGERYGAGITVNTPLESWSMGKSLTATMMGILIQQGVYQLDQSAPIPEWQEAGDPRQQIRIQDILHMSSGLRFRAPQDPDFDPTLGYPDHLYVYNGGVNIFSWTARLNQQWPPNTVGRYRNCDPVLTNYLVRLAVEKRGENYHEFPQRALFDKIGIRTMIMETDPYGNFLTQGFEFASARDWARLGNLYLQDGVWNNERILPEGFVKFVSTLAEPWVKDGRPIYGGFFWINGDGARPIPKDAYMMLGAGGQSVMIIPSKELVVVRLGHYKGAAAGGEALDDALRLLMKAVK